MTHYAGGQVTYEWISGNGYRAAGSDTLELIFHEDDHEEGHDTTDAMLVESAGTADTVRIPVTIKHEIMEEVPGLTSDTGDASTTTEDASRGDTLTHELGHWLG